MGAHILSVLQHRHSMTWSRADNEGPARSSEQIVIWHLCGFPKNVVGKEVMDGSEVRAGVDGIAEKERGRGVKMLIVNSIISSLQTQLARTVGTVKFHPQWYIPV